MSGMKRIANAIANEPGFAGQTGEVMGAKDAKYHVDPAASTPNVASSSQRRQAGPKTPATGVKGSGKARPVAANAMVPGGNIPKAL